MSEIFKTEHFETANNSLLSFKDCPNHCVDGYYVNPYTHKKLLCEYCRNKRKSMVVTQNREEVSGDTISELLRIPQSLQGYAFDINTVFPELKNDVRNEEDLEEVKTEMNTLMNGIAVGTLPEYSILFDLGVKTFENNFIYPYLMRAYMEGLSVAPFLTSYDVCRLRYAQEYGEELDEYNLTFNDLINFDVCVLKIELGATNMSASSVGSIMELRAYKDKPTIIFANDMNKLAYKISDEIVYDKKTAKRYHINTKLAVDREDTADVSGLSTAEFEKLLKSKNYM